MVLALAVLAVSSAIPKLMLPSHGQARATDLLTVASSPRKAATPHPHTDMAARKAQDMVHQDAQAMDLITASATALATALITATATATATAQDMVLTTDTATAQDTALTTATATAPATAQVTTLATALVTTLATALVTEEATVPVTIPATPAGEDKRLRIKS